MNFAQSDQRYDFILDNVANHSLSDTRGDQLRNHPYAGQQIREVTPASDSLTRANRHQET